MGLEQQKYSAFSSGIHSKYRVSSALPSFFTFTHAVGTTRPDMWKWADTVLRLTRPRLISDNERLNKHILKLVAVNADKQSREWKKNLAGYDKREKLFLKKLEYDKELILKHVKKVESSAIDILPDSATLARREKRPILDTRLGRDTNLIQNVENIVDERFGVLAGRLRNDLLELGRADVKECMERLEQNAIYEKMRTLGK